MSEGNFIFEGDCLPPQFWSRKEFRAMPTAIVDAYTSEGFAVIADGLSVDEQKVSRRKNNQKISCEQSCEIDSLHALWHKANHRPLRFLSCARLGDRSAKSSGGTGRL